MDDKLSLTELQLIIRDALYTSLPGMYWVSAEISEIKENYTGHCYLELVEKKAGEENIRARLRAVIWANRYRMLKPFFENITGEVLKEGLRVLIKVSIEYHEIYGLSLIISDIDPAYTIGEIAIRRLQIIRKLEEEGVITMNKELLFPSFPRHIAVISSKNAAGYSDFLKQLQENANGYVFYTALFESVLQGAETSKSVINALDLISENIELFDVVAIIRGGGSQTDLSWFDNYEIAYHITQFPLPVITGIGHDKDRSVVDLVANTSVKTPTAAADFLISRMSETNNHLIELGNRIADISTELINSCKAGIESSGRNLLYLSKMNVTGFNDKLSDIKINLVSKGKDYIKYSMRYPLSQYSRLGSVSKTLIGDYNFKLSKNILNITYLTRTVIKHKKDKIDESELVLNIIDPVNILKRGFTITLMNGKILKNCKHLITDNIIDTQFIDGIIRSRVVDKNKE